MIATRFPLLRKFFSVLGSVHSQFRTSVLFGPLVFTVLTVCLLLPPFGGASTDAIKYAALLVGGALFCWTLRSGPYATHPWAYRWVLVWVLWVSASTLLAGDRLYAFLGSYPRYNSSWLVYVLFAGLMCAVIGLGRKGERVAAGLAVLCGFAVALFGVLQAFGIGYYGGIESFFTVRAYRVPSLVGNPNFSSWFVAVLVPFGLLALSRARRLLPLLSWIGFIFLSFWSLVMFSSRGAILAAGVGVAMLIGVLFCLKKIRQASVVLGVAAVSVAIFYQYYTIYRPSIREDVVNIAADSSASERFIAWHMAGEAWRAHPVFGLGPGNFDQFYWEKLPSTLMGGGQYFDDAHNLLFVLLADLGLPGFILFCALLGFAAVVCVAHLRSRHAEGWWPAAAAGVGTWVAASLFNPTVVALWVLLALLLGIIFVSHAHTAAREFRLSLPTRLGAVMCGVLLFWIAVGITAGEYALVYSIALEPYRPYYEDAANKQRFMTKWASRLEPYNLEIQYGALATKKQTPESLARMATDVRRAFRLHPESARAALLAAQIMADTYGKTKQDSDRAVSDAYLKEALEKSSGYPVTYVWAAYYYWTTGRVELSERYARIAAAKQPQYYYNWLLLAKQARERGNFQAMTFALSKAQGLVPGNQDLAKVRKQLATTKDVKSFDIIPGEPPVLVRLHQ